MNIGNEDLEPTQPRLLTESWKKRGNHCITKLDNKPPFIVIPGGNRRENVPKSDSMKQLMTLVVSPECNTGEYGQSE